MGIYIYQIWIYICWHSLWHKLSVPSGILSGIYSDILSGIYAGFLSGIYCILFWISFWHSFWHSFRYYVWHLSGIYSDILSDMGTARWGLELAVEVRQCPLTSGARGWGPAVPTEIWSLISKLPSAIFQIISIRERMIQSNFQGTFFFGDGPASPFGLTNVLLGIHGHPKYIPIGPSAGFQPLSTTSV